MLQEGQNLPPEDYLDILAQQLQQGPQEGLLALPGLEDDDEETVQVAALPPRKPWWRRRGAVIAPISLAIVILLIIVLPGMLSARVLLQFKTVQVTEGDLSRTINASGTLQGATFNINFSGIGKIAEIDVTVGQHVTQGQLLAKLDLTSLEDAVNQAQAAYQVALTALKGDMANSGATSGQGGANIAAAQATLNNAEANLTAIEGQGQTGVGIEQTTLTNAEASLATAEQQAQANINAAQTMLEACPSSATVIAADGDTDGDATTPESGVTADADDVAVAAALQNCKNVATTAINQAQANANASVTTAQEAVNAAQSTLANAEATANANNINAQTVVNAAQKALNTAIANVHLNNTSANVIVNNATSQAQASLTMLYTAEHNLQNAILTAPHAGVVTVINGTIGGTPGVPTNVSTSVTGTSGTFIQIVDPSSPLQVIADVNESSIKNLKVGGSMQFTTIAYGNREFTGVVSAISPNGTTVTNGVAFPVTVDVDTNDLQGATLLPGMTAKLEFKVVQRVLLIPMTAVSFARTATAPSAANGGAPIITPTQAAMANTQAQLMLPPLIAQDPAISADMPMATFVLVPSSTPGQAVATPVVLGLTVDDNYEVLAGLTNGESVIVGVS